MTLKLKKIEGEPSRYQTLDGHYNVERQDGTTMCDHPLCDQLHERFLDNFGEHWAVYVAWHIWDNTIDDYIRWNGPVEFDTKKKAVEALERFLEKEQANAEDTNDTR